MNRLEKSGKITQNTGKLREFEINIIDISSDIKMNFVLFAKMDQVFSLKKLSIKKYWKMAKNTGKVGEFCQSGKWEPRYQNVREYIRFTYRRYFLDPCAKLVSQSLSQVNKSHLVC